VSHHAWLEKEQARIDLQGQLADARNQRAALLAQTRKEAHDSRIEAEKIIESARQDQRRAGEHSNLLRLTAPVTGTVQQLAVHTVGGVVAATQPLMQIVPEGGDIEIEAQIENKDVGFVEVGQQVEVKVDAFDYTKYGTVPARVVFVSRDAIQDEKKGLVYPPASPWSATASTWRAAAAAVGGAGGQRGHSHGQPPGDRICALATDASPEGGLA
jgi:hemolysin D